MNALYRALLVVPIITVTAGVARADEPRAILGTFSTQRLDPAPPGDDFDSVYGPAVGGEQVARVALTLDYANAPLVARDLPAPLIDHQLVLHTGVSLSLWRTFLLDSSLPIILVNRGTTFVRPGPDGFVLPAPSGPSLGSVRLGVRQRLFGDESKPIAAAAGAMVWLATGQPEEYTSDTTVRGMPYASIGGTLPHLDYAAHAGVMFQRRRDVVNVHMGREARFGVAFALLPFTDQRLGIGPELSAAVPLSPGDHRAPALASAELLGSIHIRLGEFALGAALGPGLLRGLGTPSFRALTTIAFVPREEHPTLGMQSF